GNVERLSGHLGRQLFLIAESDLNDPRIVQRREAGGYGIDAQWSDDLHHALHAVITGESNGYYSDFGDLEHVATALEQAFVYAGRYSPYRNRVHGRGPVGIPGYRFLGYMQTHDQVGNRAGGERLGEIAGPDLAKVAAAVVLTSPFVPMLFQGEEWGASSPFLYFTDHTDPELGRAVSEGRKREFEAFGWDPERIPDPQERSTFERSKLDWTEPEREPHADIVEWYRDLIELRRSLPDLGDGSLDQVTTFFDEDQRALIVQRGDVSLTCNFSDDYAKIPAERGSTTRQLLASAEDPEWDESGLVLPPTSATIWTR
ncbi:MAG TPA: DUF3459 domain-containing protein, partial [Actinomycetota bacterium]|nr:DUF3459 domain-containing protein [Actinomycetota bacterium]